MNILLTGGTSGLGRAIVELLASESDHCIYFMYLDSENYRKAADEITGNLPPAGFSTYVCNKAYLEKMSDVINKEYARSNITSDCILPEFMNTGFGNVDNRLVEQSEAQHPLKKLLTPVEVVQAVKFFVEASQQANGVKMPINAAMCINN